MIKILIKKICFIIILINLVALSLSQTLAENKEDSVTFILFGHTYVDYFALNKSIDKINSIKPAFVVFLGDNVVSGKNPKKAWEQFFKIVDNIKTKVYIVAGNHDIENEYALKYFKENISNLTYDFSYGKNQFIVLNTIYFEDGKQKFDLDLEQIKLLKFYLSKDYKNRFVLMHHCLWYDKGKEICNNQIINQNKNNVWNSKVVPFLKKEVNKIFVGDVGDTVPFFTYKNKELEYVGIGFSGVLPRKPQFGLVVKVRNVDIDKADVSVKPLWVTEEIDLTKELNYYQFKGAYSPSYSYNKHPLRSWAYLFIINNLKSVLIFVIILSSIFSLIVYTSLKKWLRRI